MKKLSVISLLSLSMLFNAHMAQAESERALSEKVKAFCAEVTPGAAYKITLDQAYQILKKSGFSLDDKDDDSLTILQEGRKILLFQMRDGDFQLYYGASGIKLTPEQINEWNRTKRLSRAYIDQEGNPVLESDLITDGGITEQNLIAFVKTFTAVSVPSYSMFLLKHGE